MVTGHYTFLVNQVKTKNGFVNIPIIYLCEKVTTKKSTLSIFVMNKIVLQYRHLKACKTIPCNNGLPTFVLCKVKEHGMLDGQHTQVEGGVGNTIRLRVG